MAYVVPGNADEEVQCPYVQAHRPLRKHLETHLIKCRKAQKNIELAICPFNASHRINEPELAFHISSCPSRASFEKYKHVVDPGVSGEAKNEVAHFHEEIPSAENWDDVDVPTYDPSTYANNAPIIRLKVGAPPSERKAFREAERRRLRDKDN